MSTKVYHPRMERVSFDVPDDQLAAWEAQGWVTKAPTRRPRRKKKASPTLKENDDA